MGRFDGKVAIVSAPGQASAPDHASVPGQASAPDHASVPGQASVPPGVGFIGLGQMGYPMAKHLREWPGGLTVCDVRADVTERFAKKGARVAASPGDVAATSGVISVMVRDDAQVEDVVCGERGLLAAAAPGTIIPIHSTIGDETAPRLAKLARAGVVMRTETILGERERARRKKERADNERQGKAES